MERLQKDGYAFRIRNLIRRFDEKMDPVLEIEELDIPEDKFVVILGNSGCGKSTLLEVLGLMSNPEAEQQERDTEILFFPPSALSDGPRNGLGENPDIEPSYDYLWLWKDENEQERENVRRRFFSFMFQHTNLFSQFTTEENIALSMVTQGVPLEQARHYANRRMEALGIGDKKGKVYPQALSGGQKQRAALARADACDFNVFLGDEPTGDLGIKDSEYVFNHIEGDIVDPKGVRTAIVVTHDIDLALERADEIVILNESGKVECTLTSKDIEEPDASGKSSKKKTWPEIKDPDTGRQYESPEVIEQFVKDRMSVRILTLTDGQRRKLESYRDHRDSEVAQRCSAMLQIADGNKHYWVAEHGLSKPRRPEEIYSWLRTYQEGEGDEEGKGLQALVDFQYTSPGKGDYSTPEQREDSGEELKKVLLEEGQSHFSQKSRYGKTLWKLFLFALLAIGFARGGLRYLEQKMSDPFVNWIGVEVAWLRRHQIPRILEALSTQETKDRYRIDKVNGYYRYHLIFWNKEKRDIYPAFGRTIDIDDPIIENINNYLVKGQIFESPDECDSCKYSENYGLIVTRKFMEEFGYDESKDMFVYNPYPVGEEDRLVPIPIRGIAEDLPDKALFISTPFFYNQRYYEDSKPYDPTKTKALKVFAPGGKTQASKLKALLEHFFAKRFQEMSPYIDDPREFKQCIRPGHTVNVTFLPPGPSLSMLDSMFQEVRRSPAAEALELVHLYDHRFGLGRTDQTYGRLSINVSKLDRVFDLKSFLAREFDLDVNLETVQARDNFQVIASLTEILSWGIIGISAAFVFVFVYLNLCFRLYNIKVFLGSLKAFGASNMSLKEVYHRKIRSLFISSALRAVGCAVLMGYGISWILSTGFGKEQYRFDLVNWYAVLFVLLVFVSNKLATERACSRILGNPPGDLINGRIDIE